MTKFIYLVYLLCTLISMCSGSAIPMWEFLGRTEKMSHLYSMFAKEVSKYCKSNGEVSITKCKHDLLTFGVTKLEKMNESHLDAMDPYQRSANDIIWDAIMDGHPIMQSKKQQTTKSPIRQPTGLFERNPLFDGMDDENEKTQNEDQKSGGNMDFGVNTDSANNNEEHGNFLPFATNIDYQYDLPAVNSPTTNYLIGPMVVRVRPDGSPVDEDRTKQLPIDDDQMTVKTGYFLSAKRPSTHLETPLAESESTAVQESLLNRHKQQIRTPNTKNRELFI